MQYRKIFIIENNIYINFYPLQTKICDEKLNALLTHFDSDKEGVIMKSAILPSTLPSMVI